MDWIASTHQIHDAEALTPKVTVFEVGAFKEIMKDKWGYKGWTLIQ